MNAITLAAQTALESFAAGLPQAACDCVHAFAPGIYIRQVTLPTGALVVGHRHKQAHLNIMLKGHMTLFHDDGSRSELRAPVMCVAPPGRKVAYIHEQTLWLNLYASECTDVETLESEFLDKSEDWQQLQAGFVLNRDADRADFEQFIWELNLDAAIVRKESENSSDLIALPQGVYKFKVGKSAIEGQGLIACADIRPGEVIAPARIEGKRTPAGRYTNHAKNPNAQMFAEANGDIYLVCMRPIGGALGGQDGDEVTIDYRHALKLNQSTKRVIQ